MGHLKPDFLKRILDKREGYNPVNFVETGTYKAESIHAVSSMFKKCYTIEVSKILFSAAKSTSKGDNVAFLYGDSAEILPQLCKELKEPTVFYLDAHWFKWDHTIGGKSTFPLWTELQVIRDRQKKDIIIVDDAHAFGRTHIHTGEEDPLPWHEVSPESINGVLIESRIEYCELFPDLKEDVYVIWMKGA